MQEVLQDANSYVRNIYGKSNPGLSLGDYYPKNIQVAGVIHEPNYSYYKKFEIIVYWSGDDLRRLNPSFQDRLEAKDGDPFYKKGDVIYRYIGYDLNGEKLYNPYFPPDKLENKPSYDLASLDDENNDIWLNIIANDPKLKNHIMANFKKSLVTRTPKLIESYFRYRRPSVASLTIALYKKTYKWFFKRLLKNIDDFSENIKLITLPTDRVKGFAQYVNTNNYYNTVLLEYQDELTCQLEIKHLAVDYDENKNTFKISDEFHPVNSINNSVNLIQGESKSFKAREIEPYLCVGYMLYKNKEEYQNALGVEGNRKSVDNYIAADEASFQYEYGIDNDNPIIIFFYKKEEKKLELDEASGHIEISSDTFDVTKAIPSDKEVRIRAKAEPSILADYAVKTVKKQTHINIYVNNYYESIDEEGNPFDAFESYKIGYVEGFYYYTQLVDYVIYQLKGVNVYNDKLKNKEAVFLKANNIGKTEAKTYSQHLIYAKLPEKIEGFDVRVEYDEETWDYKIFVDVYGDIYLSNDLLWSIINGIAYNLEYGVRNDSLILDGQVILDDSIFDGYEEKEVNKWYKSGITIEKNNYLIEAMTKNGNADTRGELVYEKLGSIKDNFDQTLVFPIDGNNIFVHTPVVNRTVLSKDDGYDARIQDKKIGLAVPLDHVMKLDLFTDFQHIEEKGYGYRDYEEELKYKSVQFDFDCYVSESENNLKKSLPNKKYYISKGRLLKFKPEVKRIYYKAARWEKEGKHHIKTINVAKNAPSSFNAEKNANLDYKNYAAFQKNDVYLSGRLFDFRIEQVFDKAYLNHDKRAYFSTGLKDREGVDKKDLKCFDKKNIEKKILPVTIGKSSLSVPVNRNIKMGYPFSFSLKTMGTYYAEKDIVSLKPRFYYIAKDGSIDKNIALYYKNNGTLVKFGENKNALKQALVYKDLAGLDDFLDIQRTSDILKENSDVDNILAYAKYNYKVSKPVFCYKPSLSILSYPFRSFVGSVNDLPDDIKPSQVMMSIQKWKGIYGLPASTIAFRVNEAGKVDFKKPIKTGSIAIYFDITVSRNHNIHGPDLAYITETSNEYINEGYQNHQAGMNYLPGTCILYSLEETADEDLQTE